MAIVSGLAAGPEVMPVGPLSLASPLPFLLGHWSHLVSRLPVGSPPARAPDRLLSILASSGSRGQAKRRWTLNAAP